MLSCNFVSHFLVTTGKWINQKETYQYRLAKYRYKTNTMTKKVLQ